MYPRRHSAIVSATTPESPTRLLYSVQEPATRIVGHRGDGKTVVETSTEEVLIQPLHDILAKAEAKFRSNKIRDKIRARRHRSPLDPHVKLLPESSVADVVHAGTVKAELERSRKAPPTATDLEGFCKILTVLYLIKQQTEISIFVKNGIRDFDLPLELSSGVERGRTRLFLNSKHNPRSVRFRLKKDLDNQEFTRLQWSVLGFIFAQTEQRRTGVAHYDLHDQFVLPFRTHRPVKRQGASGQVYRTEVFSKHHGWKCQAQAACHPHRMSVRYTKTTSGGSATDTCDVFAIKTLSSRSEKAFNAEVRILRRISNPESTNMHGHRHLITLLATYKQNDLYSLVFPWAELDLLGYWKRDQSPKHPDTIQWLAEQCIGLTEALHRIHHWDTSSNTSLLSNTEPLRRRRSSQIQLQEPDVDLHRLPTRLHGRHGDLKPENILWFPQDEAFDSKGILKITDFGISRFSKEDSKRGRVSHSPTYRSPEYAVSKVHGPACDVWALGCIFLEFVTWYCGGYHAVKRFSEVRLAPDEETDPIDSDAFFLVVQEENRRAANIKPCVISVSSDLCEYIGTH